MNKKCRKCCIEVTENNSYKNYGVLMNICKTCFVKYQKERLLDKNSHAFLSRKYYKLKASAKKRGKEFKLSFEDFKNIKKLNICFYCKNNYLVNPFVKTIDRVNNNKGYIKENCVLACFSCNVFKRTFNKTHLTKLQNIVNAIKKY